MKVAAIVPMRHDSERVKGKNYREFCGRPLYHYIVNTLIECEAIGDVYIDTDSPVIIDDVKRNYPGVKLLLRPENLRDGSIAMNIVLENTISKVDSEWYLQTHSTNPLLRADTISKAIEKLYSNPVHDSLFGVTRLQTRLYDSSGNAINHDPQVLLRTQDLPPVFEENSNLYLFTRESFMRHMNRIGENPLLFEIDAKEAWDIDEDADFEIAEMMYMQREKIV